jgi:hypothetical protein
MARDTLFISHATPQDNEFSIWLSSRLEMLGYKVWIDKQQLLGGETFWQTIQEVIRDNAVKILFVCSENVKDEKGNLKFGINREIEYATGIARENRLDDFIIPLHLDNSSFNNFISISPINQIPFNHTWSKGFNQLVEKLQKNDVPYNNSENKTSFFSDWYEERYATHCQIEKNKSELMYTSWWKIKNLPDYFYIYRFNTENEAVRARAENNNIPISKIANNLITFEPDLTMPHKFIAADALITENTTIQPVEIIKKAVVDMNTSYESEKFPTSKDTQNYFKSLLAIVYSELFRRHGLWKYQMANNRLAYYLPIDRKKGIEKIKFIYPYSNGSSKRKSIQGRYKEIGFWHYAVSYKIVLDPFICASLKSHIVFSSDGRAIIEAPKKQQSYRRNKGSRFFNAEWRDMFLAYIQRFTDLQGKIEISVTEDKQKIAFESWPEMFWSKVGYDDPKTNMSSDKIEDFHEEEIIEGDMDE